MKRGLLATIPLFLVLMAGCVSSNPMVGTWKLEISEDLKKQMPAGMKADRSVNFKADNTFVVSGEMMAAKLDAKGTYKLEDKKLAMTTTEENGKKATDENPNPPPWQRTENRSAHLECLQA